MCVSLHQAHGSLPMGINPLHLLWRAAGLSWLVSRSVSLLLWTVVSAVVYAFVSGSVCVCLWFRYSASWIPLEPTHTGDERSSMTNCSVSILEDYFVCVVCSLVQI